jgi:uncharacterized protein
MLALIVLGGLAGVAAGLLGIGGGLLIVPCLVALLPGSGWPGDTVVQAAVATSLASILLTGTGSALGHHRRGAVDWPAAVGLLPGIIAGSLLGGPLGERLGGRWLALLFSGWLLLAARRMIAPAGTPAGSARALPPPWQLMLPGLGIGLVSGLVGIGGGTLTVPYLSQRGVVIQRAVATSAAVGVAIAAAGSASHAMTALYSSQALPASALGYIDVPAALTLGLCGALSAPLGVRLAHSLPVATLRRVFAVLMVLLSAWMVVQAMRLP